MSAITQLEKRIDETLRRLFRAGNKEETRELIEIEQGILDQIADKIIPAPRGKRLFPYNQVQLLIAVTGGDRQQLFEAVFDPASIKESIRRKLKSEDASVPQELSVTVSLLEDATPELGARGFHVAVSNHDPQQEPERPTAPHCILTVLHGNAGSGVWNFEKIRINVGRLAEVRDDQQRLVRRNDLVFDEMEGIPNSTVSRAHAHIRFDEATGEFRLFDDQSAYGTSIFHEGVLTKVPPGSGRGARLVAGDEIYFGQTRVLFNP